jgi:hypothetical protein
MAVRDFDRRVLMQSNVGIPYHDGHGDRPLHSGWRAGPCSVIYMCSPMRVPMPTTAPKINGMQMMSMNIPVVIILIMGT